MVFKKLELSGFKSFAEKTALVFEPGVTAIVGPNGSGKSNVADAIKWVLGEQSARELRGGHMEDLIFNGTDGRPALNVAEVSLTFDNTSKLLPTEYSEVTITRRLYRSGESEYLLNKTQVRLKDILELLMGTGIGTSAYSLFEQGKIDQLINARPEERRAIFEEAAGITKYKTQKREALRKLEQTEANLLRLNDVIGEVRRQLSALERQVRKAQQYRDQWERLKQLELMLAQREYHRLRGERERIDAATQAVRAQEQQLQQQLQAQEAALSQRRVELEAVEQQHAEQRAQALQAAHLIDVAQRQIQTNQERMAEGRRRRAQAEQEIDTLRQQLAQTAAQIDELRRAIEATDAQRQTLESSMAAAQEGIAACEATIQRAQEAIRERKQSIVESAAQASRLRNDLTRLSSQVHGAQARLQRLELESGRVTVEQDAVSDQTARLEAELTEVRELTERLMADRQQRMAELETARLQVMEGDQQLTEAQQSLVAIESRHEILQGLVASHEGMSSGVKALLDGFRRQALGDEGIIGILADALQVEPGYEAAVEAALGELAQAIVVEHWGAAASCLVYLQQHNAGRVTILVRSAVQSGSRGAEAPVGPYELVISRVRTEPALRPLLDRLLEQAYVVPDLKTALEFQRTAIVPIRLVTLQGERVTGTSITGGSNLTADSTLVGRHQRLTQVTAELEAARERARLARLQTDEALAVEHALQTALEEADRHSQAQRTTLAQRETQYASLCQALNKLNEEQSLLKVEADEAREQRTEAQGQEGTVQTSLTELEGQLEREQAAIVETQQQIEAATRQREQDAITLAEAKTQLASVEPMRMGRQHSLGLLEQSLQGMQSTITAREQEIAELVQREAELSLACKTFERETATQRARQAADEQFLRQVASQRDELARAIARESETLQERAKALAAVRERLHECQLSTAQLGYQQEALTSRLQQVYQLAFEPASTTEQSEDQDWTAVTQDCETLRRKLEGIGPASMASIDESHELQERLGFLTAQQADLLKAKDDLHDAITKINRTTRTQFKETFQKIQQEFQATYKTLFGGGEARLVLLDEEDLLESGIEIIARPPGKTPQSISLLSGGEKALTSVALLFAVFRVKPSPFCLLDEIDAPLDEANIDRFTRALKEFLKDSQFIIITHNKKTITMADVMYGITMEEQGISKIVSVKFHDRQAEPTTASSVETTSAPPPTVESPAESPTTPTTQTSA